MKLIKFLLYLLTLLGFLLVSCNKDEPLQNRDFYIVDGWIITDQYASDYDCDVSIPGPHLMEYVDLYGDQPAGKTDQVYDLEYDLDFYCEQYTGDGESLIYEGSCSKSKKMALKVEFDEAGNCYITSILTNADIEAIVNDLMLTRSYGSSVTDWPWISYMGMLHMGFGSNLTDPPFIVGKYDHLGAEELTVSGRDTIYYNWDVPEKPIHMIREWHIELEAR